MVSEKSHIFVGRTEIKALAVGLATGALYGALQLPIPAPNVLGGNLAILFTFIGLVTVGLFRREIAFGRPGKRSDGRSGAADDADAADREEGR